MRQLVECLYDNYIAKIDDVIGILYLTDGNWWIKSFANVETFCVGETRPTWLNISA